MSEGYEQFLEGNYDRGKEEEQRKRDIAQSQRIYNTAQSLRKESRENLINMTLRDELLPAGDEEAIRELINEYALDKDNYLVDGAILTCNKATTKVQVIQGVPYGYGLSEKDENRKLTPLFVWQNASEINELPVATVKDHEVNKNVEPFQCNCIYLPDRDSEIQAILSDMENCKKYGTCRALMRLEDDWENIISSTLYLSFNHSVDGQETERAQGITMNSMLFCRHGGIITPVISGQVERILRCIYISERGATVSGKADGGTEGATKGLPVQFDFSTFERRRKFSKESPQYYISHHQDAYVDENGLIRISKIPGCQDRNDYYCVAIAPGFKTAAQEFCAPPEKGNMNYGYKLRVQFDDTNSRNYYMDVIVTDTKGSDDENDFYAHNNLIEFIVEENPSDSVLEKGNVSFDKLLGGNGLEISKVYAYEDGAMVTGNFRDGGCWEDR